MSFLGYGVAYRDTQDTFQKMNFKVFPYVQGSLRVPG